MANSGKVIFWEGVKLALPVACVIAATAVSFQAVRSATADNAASIGERREEIRAVAAETERIKGIVNSQREDLLHLLAQQNERTIRELSAIREELAALRERIGPGRAGQRAGSEAAP
jgi:hypothetical protein